MSLSLSLVAWLLLTVHALAQDVIHGRVTAVNDGDTIKVLTAEKQLLRVRVAWIDAPESSQAFGQRAKQAMSALVFGKDVELRFHTVDRYGRLIGVDLSKARRPGLESRRINIDVPAYFIDRLDHAAQLRGITRQSLIKTWLYELLKQESSSPRLP
jgi:nuclease-like protein